MENKPTQLKKIIWAVDAFSNEKLQLNVAGFLSLLIKKIQAEVEPVFVLSTSAFPEVVDRQGIMVYLPGAEERLEDLTKKSGIHTLKPNKILIQPHGGLIRNDVRAIINYAQTTKSQAIVVGTHAKLGVARLFLGSFAETLLLNSKIPIITINPSVRLSKNISSILFVTDFSTESRIAFKSVLNFAKQLNAKIILFHLHMGENETVDSNVLIAKGSTWIPARSELLRKSLLVARKKTLSWEKLAESYEVSCSSYFEYGRKNIADSAIEISSKLKTDMIAITSKKGPVASTLIGSTTRWLVRSSHCPVWVLHMKK